MAYGKFTGYDDFGCDFSGTITGTGKAYQYVSVNFGNGNCEYRNITLSGVVFSLNNNSLKVIIRNGNKVVTALFSKNA